MGDTWLKIKAWTKGVVFGAVVIYLILFLFKNSGQDIQFWWWFGHNPKIDALYMALVSFLAGAVCAALIHTTWRTMRQIRDVRSGRRLDRLERENAEVRAKAAMLQTAPAGEGTTIRVDQLGGQ